MKRIMSILLIMTISATTVVAEGTGEKGRGAVLSIIPYTDNNNVLKTGTVYSEGVYDEGNYLPKGEYVILAEDGKIGSFGIYDKSEDEYIYKESFDYCTIAYIDKDTYIILENASARPSEEVAPLDITRNGVFRVGKDFPEGNVNFTKSADAQFGYIENFYIGTKNLRQNKLLYDTDDSYTMNIRPNSYVVKLNCDIYNSGKDNITEITDDGFSKISVNLKNKIYGDLKSFESTMSVNKTNSGRLQEFYINKLYKSWQTLIVSDEDKKFADINYEALNVISDYYEILREAQEDDVVPNIENSIARALEKELQGLRKADSFYGLNNKLVILISYITEITNNINHTEPDYRFGY